MMDESTRGRRYICYKEVLPFALMVSMELVNVGVTTLFKAATRHSLSHNVFLVYIYAIGTVALLPAAFMSLRSRVLPPLSLRIMSKIGLLGLIGGPSQMMGYTGISLSSPTLASAISNLMPAFAFILAILFRLEKFSAKSRSSQAKIIGTVVSMAGAFTVTFFQGPPITFGPKPGTNWTLGAILLTGEYLLISMWYIVQAQLMKDYPSEITVVFFYNLCVTFMATIVAIIAEPDPDAWRVRGIGLASVICSGIFACGLSLSVHAWAVRLKGPFYVASFRPVSIVIAVIMGVLILGDTLYLWSLAGAMIISIGFYTVIWAKVKEEMVEDFEARNLGSPRSHQVPFLHNYKASEA